MAQESFGQSVLDEMTALDPWHSPAPIWSSPVRASLETLVLGVLRAEQKRGPSLIQAHNFHVLGVALSCLVDQAPVDVAFPGKVATVLPSLPAQSSPSARQAISSLRGYALRFQATRPPAAQPITTSRPKM